MSGRRVVVVGGGLAGLAAALRCADAGARVTLLESRARLGGATFSFRRDGLWVDNGQHVFLRCFTAYRDFLRRIGSTDRMRLQERLAIPVLAPGRAPAWLRRNELPAPLHLVGSLARYAHLSPLDRLRVVRTAAALAGGSALEAADDRTFEAWLRERRQSTAAIGALWNLIALPALNLPADRASLGPAAMVFRTGLLLDRAAGDLGYATAPLSLVHGGPAAKALDAAGAEVRLRTPVRSIATADEGFEVRAGSDGRWGADAVILAVPHEAAEGLLPAGAVPEAARLRELGSSPIVNLHVIYDRRVTSLPFAAAVDSPVQWMFDRTASSELDLGQYLAISLSAADREVDEPTERLRDRFLPALSALFPAARTARVRDFFVTRERSATFRQVPGTGALRPPSRTGVPGLFLAGAWTATGWPATMEGAVRSGMAAAELAVAGTGVPNEAHPVVAA